MSRPKRLSTSCPECVGSELVGFNIQAPGSAAWPAANRAYFIPIRNDRPRTTSTIWWWNGTTLTGNADAGIYDTAGVRLGSIGSTARSGSGARQAASLAVALPRGLFYLALVCASGSGTFQRYAFPNIGTQRASGCLLQDAAFPLATNANPATFAAMDASLYVPLAGVDFA